MTGPASDVPPASATARELMNLARQIERARAQRAKVVKRLVELDGVIRERSRLLKSLASLVAAPPLLPPAEPEAPEEEATP